MVKVSLIDDIVKLATQHNLHCNLMFLRLALDEERRDAPTYVTPDDRQWMQDELARMYAEHYEYNDRCEIEHDRRYLSIGVENMTDGELISEMLEVCEMIYDDEESDVRDRMTRIDADYEMNRALTNAK